MDEFRNFIAKAEKCNPSFDEAKLRAVYDYAKELKGCEPDLSLAEAILGFKPDESSLVAALFYDVLGEMDVSNKQLLKIIGNDDAEFLSYFKKLNGISYNVKITDPETIRAMLMVMAKDLRVILIWLASAVLIAEKIDELSASERKKFALRAMNIFAPIAARLGMYEMKHKLEDNSFKYLNPDQYKFISDQLKKFGRKKAKHIKEVKKNLEDFLKKNRIKGNVNGRIKSIYSIYRKMKAKNKASIDDLFDVIAMRIVLPTKINKEGRETVDHLYQLLGFIHSKWTPVQNRFKDYIAVPKPNGYQSLHTIILGIAPKFLGQPVEVQIRSERMHREAELGIATHWVYEEHGKLSGVRSLNPAQKVCVEWFKKLKDSKAFEDLSGNGDINIFEDRIFVLTPKGDVKDLPVGSTIIDFAYDVHTDIGHRASMAKVNGAIAPLSYKLENGDIVEIILKPKPSPKVEWLSFIKTNTAKERIKMWMRQQKNEHSFKAGKDIINKHLKRIQIPAPRLKAKPRGKKESTAYEVLVGGESGLPVRFAKCCNPKYDNPIVGYVTTYGYIAVHKSDCRSLKRNISSRAIEVSWADSMHKTSRKYAARIIVEANNRIGLLRDIAAVIANMEINIVDVALMEKKDNFIKRVFILEVEDYEILDQLVDHIEEIPGIIKVYSQASTPKP